MKKLFVMFVAAAFLFAGSAMAAKQAPAAPAAPAAAKKEVMSATGLVKELTDQMLKLERKVKGKVEVMDFVLKAALADIKAGDKVKVNYVVEGGNNLAIKVKKVVPKVKGQVPAAVKAPSAAPVPPPATKGPVAPLAAPAAPAAPPAAPAAPAAK